MGAATSEVTTLLWTGGWDSTFRLLYLLLVKRRAVQPYYLIDAARPSTGRELRALKEIKAHLFRLDPETRALLRRGIFQEVGDIPAHAAVTDAFRRLRKAYGIGGQYDWMSRFARDQGLDGLEVSIAADDGRIFRVLKPVVVPVERNGERFFEISRDAQGSDEFTVFGPFRFPLLELSKRDLERLSREHGFDPLLELSWFCHRPRSNGAACGTCNPCICAMDEGMGRRIPRSSRARYYSRRYLAAAFRSMKALGSGGRR